MKGAREAPLRVLRVYHSAVVTPWRRREAELRALGVAVATVAPARWNEGGSDVALEVQPGERVHRVRTFGRHPYRFVYSPLGLWRALRRERPAVLDVHEEPASLAAFETYVLARLVGVRAPFCLYSAQNLHKRYPLPFRWIERFLLRRAAAVHSCNAAVEGVLRAKGYRGPVHNLGLGVDVAAYAPPSRSHAAHQPEQPGAVSAPAGDGVLRVGYVGRLEARKGIFVLLDAVTALPTARVTFVGAGPAANELRSGIAQRGVQDRAEVTGFAAPEALAERYRSFHVVVVPSLDTPRWQEQFGRVAVEAMAAGVPVVVSTGGALPEVVADAGVVVAAGDAGALSECLRCLAGAPARRAALAKAGLARAAHFSWAAVAGRQAALYQEMTAAVAHPGGGAAR